MKLVPRRYANTSVYTTQIGPLTLLQLSSQRTICFRWHEPHLQIHFSEQFKGFSTIFTASGQHEGDGADASPTRPLNAIPWSLYQNGASAFARWITPLRIQDVGVCSMVKC